MITTLLMTSAALTFSMAQTSDSDPQALIGAIIAGLSALLSNFIITLLKTIPYLGNDDKDKLATAILQIISVITGLIVGYVIALFTQYLGLIQDSQTQVLLISILTPVLNEILYRIKKLGK